LKRRNKRRAGHAGAAFFVLRRGTQGTGESAPKPRELLQISITSMSRTTVDRVEKITELRGRSNFEEAN
jgi:hypothetical protein